MTKFQNKYRSETLRLQNWDYGWNAPYFITVNAYKHQCFFGQVHEGKMQLSEIGKIVENEWLRTFDIRQDMNLKMGEYIVMPNHFHAILIIGLNAYNSSPDMSKSPKNQFGPQRKNLASVMRGFKSAVTMKARAINPVFAWQSGFWDRIIKQPDDYRNTAKYILNNPAKWSKA